MPTASMLTRTCVTQISVLFTHASAHAECEETLKRLAANATWRVEHVSSTAVAAKRAAETPGAAAIASMHAAEAYGPAPLLFLLLTFTD